MNLTTLNPLKFKSPSLEIVGWMGLFILCLLAGIRYERYWLAALPFALAFGCLILRNYTILYWCLIGSIAFSITLDFNKQLSTDFPSEFLSIILTGCFWVMWWIHKPKSLNFLWNNKLFWAIGIIWLWAIICTTTAVNQIIAIKYVLAKGWYITSFLILTFYLIRSIEDFKKLFWALYLPIFITAVYSFFRTAIGGFSFENTNDYSLPFYDNHVIYATSMSLILPFVFIARHWYKRGSVLRLFLNISIPFLLLAIYFSYTRACYLALMGGITLILALRWRKLVLSYILAALIVLASLLIFSKDYFYLRLAPDYNTTVMHDEFKDHLISTFYGKDASSMERLNMWISVFRMYQEKPITGYGPNNFPSTYKPYSVMYFKTWVSDNPLNLSCHNYFWLLLAEQGLVGLAFFIILLGYILFLLQKLYFSTTNKEYQQLILALTAGFGIFIVILFFNDLIETNKNGSLFFIFIALIIKLQSWIEAK